MNYSEGIDLALKHNCSRAFEKIAAMEAAKYRDIEELCGYAYNADTKSNDVTEIEWSTVEILFSKT